MELPQLLLVLGRFLLGRKHITVKELGKYFTKMPTIPIVHIKPLYLARDEAAAFLAISASLFEKLVQNGNAPKPRKISAGRCAWLVSELECWGNSRPISDLLPPQNSRYGRAGSPPIADASR